MRLFTRDIEATFKVVKPFRLPCHRGGMLHGILGRALRKVACARAAPCEGACAAPGACGYSRLFDPPAPAAPPHRLLADIAEPPGPVVLVLPPPGAVALAAGAELTWRLRLFGAGQNGELDVLERALGAACELPFGKDEGRVAPVSVTRYAVEEHAAGKGAPAEGRLAVRFVTPVRIKQKGKSAAEGDIDFARLFATVWRRLTMVCALYGEYGPADDEAFAALREGTRGVRTAARDLESMRWEHFSAEQGVNKPLRGQVGEVVFEGDVGPYLSALRLGERVLVGSHTSFGMGRVEVALT